MDKGAARSRKREEKAQKAAEREFSSRLAQLTNDKSIPSPKEPKARKERPQKKRFDPSDKSQYRPKAIRSSHALIYTDEKFDLPPPAERLAGVTRVDLEGSGCTNVEWLQGMGVTWLNLKGCAISEGWDAVGSLSGLSVLNISGCGLTALPRELKELKNLKAIVAMNNEWTGLDADVVSGWDQLNSMIVSHSPNLTSLPDTLATLPHLAKLTLSHCPKLAAAGLPDLSPLPLLRDVRANNLPRLSSLPSHIATWGTGNLALAGKTKEGDARGDGLEVLDVGNCALPLSSISALFALSLPPGGKPKHVWKLRSITLQANPLTLEEEKYPELLQASPALPRLQIIDSKRVVERKNAGAVPESKAERKARERKERKMGPTGANTSAGKMRSWGGDMTADGDGERKVDKKRKRRDDETPAKQSSELPKKRKERDEQPPTRPPTAEAPKKRKERYFEVAAAEAADAPATQAAPAGPNAQVEAAPDAPAKKRKRKHGKSKGDDDAQAAVDSRETSKEKHVHKEAREGRADKNAREGAAGVRKDGHARKEKKPSKSETAVLGVVDVAPKAGGIDLKNMLEKDSHSGLGVGGW